MARKIAAIATILVMAVAWLFTYDFVESHVEIGWLIGFCIVSVIVGALLASMVWDWAFDRDPAR
jgi:protein-S-isoprenylcysteine O-methyltransferase Ste14